MCMNMLNYSYLKLPVLVHDLNFGFAICPTVCSVFARSFLDHKPKGQVTDKF